MHTTSTCTTELDHPNDSKAGIHRSAIGNITYVIPQQTSTTNTGKRGHKMIPSQKEAQQSKQGQQQRLQERDLAQTIHLRQGEE